jgi:hypothetical protein
MHLLRGKNHLLTSVTQYTVWNTVDAKKSSLNLKLLERVHEHKITIGPIRVPPKPGDQVNSDNKIS